jgi:ATP-GRASP peptide maturase of grasp-with-spasm system
MILIFASNLDYNAKKVMEWLKYFGMSYRCIHSGEIKLRSAVINSDPDTYKMSDHVEIEIGDEIVNLDEVEAVWYRSAQVMLKNSYFHPVGKYEMGSLDYHLSTYMDGHCRTQEQFIVHLLKSRRTLGNNGVGSANKLIAIHVANQLGIDVPHTYFAQESLMARSKANFDNLITKSIDTSLGYSTPHARIMCYTSRFDKDKLRVADSNDSLVFTQREVRKKYEIRSFYIRGKFFSSAILSQANEHTQVDHRKYHLGKRNRTVPFKLPADLEEKLHEMCQKLGYDTGSIDLIVGTDNRFYFLEINPVGQYANYAKHCNYNLHKLIAEYLAYGKS